MAVDILFQLENQIDLGVAPLGQTLLIIGISTTVPASANMIPYLFKTPRSVTKFYGYNAFSMAFHEVYKQGAPFISTMSVSSFDDLPDALEVLTNFDIDIICIPEYYYDTDLATMMGIFLQEKVSLGYPPTMIIPATGDLIHSDPLALQRSVDPAGFDSSPFIALAAGNILYNTNTVNQYQTNTATAIAGLIGASPSERSIVNKTINDVTIPTRWTDTEIPVIYGNGYNFLERKPDLSVVALGGRTISDQDYLDLTNSRTAQLVIVSIKKVADDLIGNSPSVNIMRTKIDATMNALVSAKRIRGYAYNLDYDAVQGTATIDMNVVPVFSIREINVTATINLTRIYA